MKKCFVFRAFSHVCRCFSVITRGKKTWQSKAAFSLVEMLMALLVASLLLAALAPVMTRKFNDNINVSGSGNGLDGSPETLSCYAYTDTNPAWNITLDKVYYANFVIASGGGGGAGASVENVSSKSANITGSSSATAVDTYNEKTIPITDAMTNIKISTLVGGGGGGGRGYSTKSETGWAIEKQSDCEPFGVYIPAANNGGTAICVSKYNPGEGRTGSPSIPSSVTSVPADGTTSCASKTTNCCWYGNNGGSYPTANTSYCDASANGMTYSGCYRTLCNWNAASAICANWKPKGSSGPTGRLPTKDEMTAWKNSGLVSDNKTTKTPGTMNWNSSVGAGLQLCNDIKSANTGAVRCYRLSSKCKGASSGSYANICYAEELWSGTVSSGTSHYAYKFTNSVFQACASNDSTIARSVRCVVEGGAKTLASKSYAGGSGGSGAYMKDVDISEYVRQAQLTGGGKIVLRGGNGGKGGNGSVAGSNSYVYVYDKNNNLIYGIGAYGGGKGADATSTSGGAGGKCYKYDTGSKTWVSTTCTGSNGYSGTSGSSYTYSTYGSAVSAPRGANSAYNSSGGGSGGTTSHTAGYSASSYGAGGGAGTGMYTSDSSYSDGSGGSGSGGIAEITYQERYPAAGGGGGGAGSVALIKNINVGQNTTCSFVIGKGGEGGEKGIKGVDGGDSYVKCSTTPEFRISGGKGGSLGKSASASLSTPEGGKKGKAGTVGEVILGQVTPENRIIKTGEDGTDGKGGEIASGGKGGTSGTGTKGGCGGLYKETGVCELPEVLDMASLEGQGFTYNHIIVPTYANLMGTNPSLGTAGAGGGGGGWDKQLGSGKGGNGMPGYICVYWKKME